MVLINLQIKREDIAEKRRSSGLITHLHRRRVVAEAELSPGTNKEGAKYKQEETMRTRITCARDIVPHPLNKC